jgi:beta-galactosidase
MKKNIKLIPLFTIMLLMVSQVYAKTGTKTLFDKGWDFQLGDSTTLSIGSWQAIDLPHDWSIHQNFDEKAPAGSAGGFLPTGKGIYRKTFRMDNVTGKKWLYFEGVYMNSKVYVNGQYVGGHPYGYSPFFCDISSAVRKGDNTVVVTVDNSRQPNSRWYTGSGIYRHVWLIDKPLVHLDNWSIHITTPDTTTAKASLSVINNSDKPFKGNVEWLSQKQSIRIAPHDTAFITMAVHDNFKVWSPFHPGSQESVFTLRKGKNIVDQEAVKFQVRTISFSQETGFLLNGKPVKINGACAHADNGILGTAAFDEAEQRKVLLLKKAGFNTVRTSHNLPSEAFLNACDEYGLMVIDECFDKWRQPHDKYDYSTLFDKWADKDVEVMVRRDRNHGSIIAWSVGNEIIERKSPEAVKTAHRLRQDVLNFDTTRPVTSALAAWDRDWEIYDPLAAEQDVVGYNYLIFKAESDHQRVPSRIMWQTESYPRDAFRNWKLSSTHSYIIGDFVWTGLDYFGESGIGRYWYAGEISGEPWEHNLYPWHASYCGDVDLTGWRKPISHYRSLLWQTPRNNYYEPETIYMAVREPETEKEKISTSMWGVHPTWESWNWEGWEDKDIEVVVYSRKPGVKLFLNDLLIGEKATTEKEQYMATFKVPYKPGTIRAVASDGSTTEIHTAGAPYAIKVENASFNHGIDNDVSFYTITIVDKDGNICPNADNSIKVTVTGEASLQALGNANGKDIDKLDDAEHHVWKGRALLVLRNHADSPHASITVSAQGLRTQHFICSAAVK